MRISMKEKSQNIVSCLQRHNDKGKSVVILLFLQSNDQQTVQLFDWFKRHVKPFKLFTVIYHVFVTCTNILYSFYVM